MRLLALFACAATLSVVKSETSVTRRRALTQEAVPDTADVVYQLVRPLSVVRAFSMLAAAPMRLRFARARVRKPVLRMQRIVLPSATS
jgi:hypothetical protein